MLIYEVNLEISSDVEKQFRDWLPEHIQHVLDTKCFTKADWYERNISFESNPNKEFQIYWTVHYMIKNLET